MVENLVENESEKELCEQKPEEKKCKCNGLKWVGAFLVAVVIAFGIFCFCYVPKTPEFALYETFKAIKSHNYEQASYYVNIDKIAENRFNEIKKEAMNDPELANNPFAGLAFMFIDAMKDQVVTLVKAGFKKVVEEPNEKIENTPDINVAGFLVVKSYNDVKLSKENVSDKSVKFQLNIEDKDPILLFMDKVDKTWQIVDITGYNLMEK